MIIHQISEMQEFLAGQMEQMEEYDESLVRRMVEEVTVYEKKFSYRDEKTCAEGIDILWQRKMLFLMKINGLVRL